MPSDGRREVQASRTCDRNSLAIEVDKPFAIKCECGMWFHPARMFMMRYASEGPFCLDCWERRMKPDIGTTQAHLVASLSSVIQIIQDFQRLNRRGCIFVKETRPLPDEVDHAP